MSSLTKQLIYAGCFDAMKDIPSESVDLVVTDPPYGITFMGKDWDKALPSIDIWKEVVRVLKPGAFAFVMSSARQDVLSRMIIRLEDSGFVIGFSSIYWVYATGFPKALNIQKKIKNEKYKGAFGGFQPKPAVEVIIVVMKPLSERTYIEQIKANGKGVTWMGDCRIPYESNADKERATKECPNKIGRKSQHFSKMQNPIHRGSPLGRFPSNLLVSDKILDSGDEDVSGEKKEYKIKIKQKGRNYRLHKKGQVQTSVSPLSKGYFSRYFDLDEWAKVNGFKPGTSGRSQKDIFPFFDVPKATEKEKRGNMHPTIKPLRLMHYLIILGSRKGEVILDPFMGSGTTCVAAEELNRGYIGIEQKEEYYKIAVERVGYAKVRLL